MTTCAVINSENLVVNIIVAEISDLPPLDCILIATPDANGNFAQIGGAWNGTQFLPAGN